jgi:twitching motility protein PilT
VTETTVARLDPIFDEALAKRASDLHVAPARPPFARVRGELVNVVDGVLSAKDVEEMIDELLTPQQRARLGIEHSLTFAYAYAHKEGMARFRAQIVRMLGGTRATFRVVARRPPTLAEIGCPEVVWRLGDRRSGLVLVAGPSGAGKTTTLGALVDHINKTRACHVVTVEDPIEMVHEPARAQITQREVGVHVSSVAAALENAPRENADVVLVSALRTRDEIRAAVALANTGIAVFAGVPTNGVVATIEHLLCALDDRMVLADALAAVVAQQLVSDIAVHEVLLSSPAVATAIREGKTRDLLSIMKSGEPQGMLTFDLAFERLMQAGKLSPERAFELSFDKEAFAKVVGKVRPDLVNEG